MYINFMPTRETGKNSTLNTSVGGYSFGRAPKALICIYNGLNEIIYSEKKVCSIYIKL